MRCTVSAEFAAHLPPFRPRPPWWGGDLQTLRNHLTLQPTTLAGERLWARVADGSGDQLALSLHRPPQPVAGKALILLCHGLGGCEDSPYILHATQHFLQQGHIVVRFNARGAAPSRQLCRLHYHAGRSEDVHCAMARLAPYIDESGLVAIGFSISGNTLLKLAGELAGGRYTPVPLRALITVSAPFDLHTQIRFIMRPRAALYQRHILNALRQNCLTVQDSLPDWAIPVLRRARNFWQFDNEFQAPMNGFKDADDYYRQSAGLHFMAAIRIPTLLIQAHNDPVVTVAPYCYYPWQDNRLLFPLLVASGGHVGFHSPEGLWHLVAIDAFLAHYL